MPFYVSDRVLETSTTTGTGTFTVAGAVSGYRAFSTVATINNDWFFYTIEGGTEWEVGVGVRASATTFTRTAALVVNGSSGVGVLVNFSAGTKLVWMDMPGSALQGAGRDPLQSLIINGAFQVAQALPSGTGTGTSIQAADCWWTSTSMASATITSGRTTPALAGQTNSYILTSTTGAAVGAAQRAFIYQPIEGSLWNKLSYSAAGARTSTLSFWVFSTISGTMVVAIRNATVARSYVKTIVINAGATWEYKQIQIPGDVTGTWGFATGVGGYVSFGAAAGTNFLGVDATWQAGDFTGVSGNTNFMATNGNQFAIAAVSLFTGVEGPQSARSIDMHRGFPTELAMCQRYYEKSFPLATAPAQNLGVGNSPFVYAATNAAGTIANGPSWPFQVRKRAAPTITGYSPGNASAEVYNIDQLQVCSGTNFRSTEAYFSVSTVNSGSGASGDLLGIDWTADARLS